MASDEDPRRHGVEVDQVLGLALNLGVELLTSRIIGGSHDSATSMHARTHAPTDAARIAGSQATQVACIRTSGRLAGTMWAGTQS